jgi:hypothetical protein
MKKTRLPLIGLIGLLSCLSSCDKTYEEVIASTPAVTEFNEDETLSGARIKGKISKSMKFLAGHGCKKWNVTKYFIAGVDYTNILFQECSLDNIQIFSLDEQYLEIEGATKCNPSDPYIYDSGTFEFSASNAKWTLNASHLATVFDVIELTPVSFKISYTDPDFGLVEIWLEPFRNVRPHRPSNLHTPDRGRFSKFVSPF